MIWWPSDDVVSAVISEVVAILVAGIQWRICAI